MYLCFAFKWKVPNSVRFKASNKNVELWEWAFNLEKLINIIYYFFQMIAFQVFLNNRYVPKCLNGQILKNSQTNTRRQGESVFSACMQIIRVIFFLEIRVFGMDFKLINALLLAFNIILSIYELKFHSENPYFEKKLPR